MTFDNQTSYIRFLFVSFFCCLFLEMESLTVFDGWIDVAQVLNTQYCLTYASCGTAN